MEKEHAVLLQLPSRFHSKAAPLIAGRAFPFNRVYATAFISIDPFLKSRKNDFAFTLINRMQVFKDEGMYRRKP